MFATVSWQIAFCRHLLYTVQEKNIHLSTSIHSPNRSQNVRPCHAPWLSYKNHSQIRILNKHNPSDPSNYPRKLHCVVVVVAAVCLFPHPSSQPSSPDYYYHHYYYHPQTNDAKTSIHLLRISQQKERQKQTTKERRIRRRTTKNRRRRFCTTRPF